MTTTSTNSRLGTRALLCVAAVAAAVLTSTVWAEQGAPARPAPAAAGVGQGQAMFAKVGCAGCHGEGGVGTPAGSAVAGTNRTLPDFIAYVRRPAGAMPPHSAQMVSDQALGDIHAFLRTRTAPAPTAAPTGRVAQGGTLYKEHGCYQCHSNEAQGGMQGPRLGPSPVPYVRFHGYVRNPTNDMPPYSSKVTSDQDIADIYAWIAARPVPPAVSSIPLLAR